MTRPLDVQYVLRVWRDGAGEDSWRASLRELKGGEPQYFSSPEQLTGFLETLAAEGKSDPKA